MSKLVRSQCSKICRRLVLPSHCPSKYEGDPRSNANTSVISSTFCISKIGLHVYVINKGYFSEAFLFKPRGGRNRKPRKYPLFCF